ncbi:hypothetical protein QF035_007049 [Streptomyces umbrinus]|uniref:Uncharacterized protein n=1 Tax=Streptomyces umbrinus TaxID=67370 RepID=A0ABU0T1Q0_9ACTN|nr:hypothetical protein [Streptomyces umbrinus]
MAGSWHDPAVAIMVDRAVLAHRLFTGISQHHLACLVEELALPWQADLEGRRHAARGGARKRATGAGARHQLVFVGPLVESYLATLALVLAIVKRSDDMRGFVVLPKR